MTHNGKGSYKKRESETFPVKSVKALPWKKWRKNMPSEKSESVFYQKKWKCFHQKKWKCFHQIGNLRIFACTTNLQKRKLWLDFHQNKKGYISNTIASIFWFVCSQYLVDGQYRSCNKYALSAHSKTKFTSLVTNLLCRNPDNFSAILDMYRWIIWI